MLKVAWTELVNFVECPECEASNEMGTGLVWSGVIEWKCERCGADFMVAPPEDAR